MRNKKKSKDKEEPQIKISAEAFQKESNKILEDIFKENGLASYNFEIAGKEYDVMLFDTKKNLGLVSYWEDVDGGFKEVFVGVCKKGNEKNFVPFENKMVAEENFTVYKLAKDLAIEMSKDW